MEIHYITSNNDLETFVQHIWDSLEASQYFITVDTEFQREKTYYPVLCLIQVATAQQIGIIDPLSPGIDLQLLWDVLQTPTITKVIHSARQDLEIFNLMMNGLPQAVFDTQIAAMVCGFGESVSYETLVSHYTRQTLDKSMQRTDWKKRPLNDRQLEYAAGDVRFLRQIYVAIRDYLNKSQRWTWFEDELNVLLKPETYVVDINTVWRRLKLINHRPEFLARLQAIGRLREELARYHNVPRSHLIPDEALVDMATFTPLEIDAFPQRILFKIKHLPNTLPEHCVTVMQQALAQPPETWPRLTTQKAVKLTAPHMISLLECLLSLRADQLRIVPRLLATRDEIQQVFLNNDHATARFLHGWRFEAFGKDALELVKGESIIKIVDNKIKVESVDKL